MRPVSGAMQRYLRWQNIFPAEISNSTSYLTWSRRLAESSSSSSGSTAFNLIMVIVCVASASIACGLTQGLLSLNPLEMHVKMRSGSIEEKEQAARVLPLIRQHHLLLVTLMLFNATANEAMPLFLDQLVPTAVTIILSVTLVLLFGEIIPSAIFTGPSQLKIASFLAPFTWFIIFVLYPIAFPLSKVLDVWLGHDDGMTIFNRKEIYTMMQIQQEEAPKRGIHVHNTVMNEEVTMIGGALALRDKTVEEVMTRDVFMLSINEKLTLKTLWKIFHSGCSRIPIYELDRNDVVSVILVKDLLFIDPDVSPRLLYD
jgi:metal transporter CNNM